MSRGEVAGRILIAEEFRLDFFCPAFYFFLFLFYHESIVRGSLELFHDKMQLNDSEIIDFARGRDDSVNFKKLFLKFVEN